MFKRDGTPRFCVDFRYAVNNSLVEGSWSIPNIDSLIISAGGPRFISVFHIHSACHQRRTKDDNVPKTALSTTKENMI